MDEELKGSISKIVETQRELAEKHGTHSTEYKSFVEKSEADAKRFDEANEKAVQALAAQEKEAEELKDRIKTLEELRSSSNLSNDPAAVKSATDEVMNALLKNQWESFIGENGGEAKARQVFTSLAKAGYQHAEGAAVKTLRLIDEYRAKASNDLLRSDIGEVGGFLCPPEYSNELEKNLTEFSPVRQFARVKKTGSKTYSEPLRTAIPTASRPGEAETGGKSISGYQMIDWTPLRMTNTTPVTQEELLFNGYNLASELLTDNSEAFAVKEGQEFFNGSGVNGGLGFSNASGVTEVETSGALAITMDDVIGLSGQLKTGYNPMYMFNRSTLVYLRTLKDSDGRYLWNVDGNGSVGAPSTINGYRYSSAFIDFNNPTVSEGIPILFADMMKFYQIVDRTDISVIRDEFTAKREGIVEYTMNKFTYGRPKIAEAGVRLKVKAS